MFLLLVHMTFAKMLVFAIGYCFGSALRPVGSVTAPLCGGITSFTFVARVLVFKNDYVQHPQATPTYISQHVVYLYAPSLNQSASAMLLTNNKVHSLASEQFL